MAVAAAAVFAAGRRRRRPAATRRYTVELDNAFGLIEGADVKVAGVRAGQDQVARDRPEDLPRARRHRDHQEGLRRPAHGRVLRDAPAVADRRVLRRLHARHEAASGSSPAARIPVEQTGSTVPADLVNNIMRRPYRERFSILLGELGAGLAARGEDLNETIRRANPALRETDKVLAQLAEQRAVIRELTDERRARRRRGSPTTARTSAASSREARDTASASADRYDGLREQFQRFPDFLRELRPTMQLLGEAADSQRPALVEPVRQRAAAAQVPRRPRPVQRGVAARLPLAGRRRPHRQAARSRPTRPRLAELAKFAGPLDEIATNLAITLEHLDDRHFAVEKDPRSPGGEGFTGLRGAAAVHLPPDAGGEHLRRELVPAEGLRLPGQHLRAVHGRRAGEDRGQAALPRDPRPEPARHRPAGPDGDADARSAARSATATRKDRRGPRPADAPSAATPDAAPQAESTPAAPKLPDVPALPPSRAGPARRRPRRPAAASASTPAPPTRSSTSCSAHETAAAQSVMANPVLVGRGDAAGGQRGHVPGVERQQGPAVRADASRSWSSSPTAPTCFPATRSARAASASASSAT